MGAELRRASQLTPAQHEIVRDHVGLAISAAKTIQCPGLDYCERCSAAFLALFHAARTWNPELGGNLASHVFCWTRYVMKEDRRAKFNLIRIPHREYCRVRAESRDK